MNKVVISMNLNGIWITQSLYKTQVQPLSNSDHLKFTIHNKSTTMAMAFKMVQFLFTILFVSLHSCLPGKKKFMKLCVMVDLVQLGVCDIMTGHYWNVGD